MKKVNILKSVATAVILTIFCTGAIAQVTVTNPQILTRPAYNAAYFSTPANFTLTGTETETVGAQAPYYVIPDSNVNGPLFNPSTFEWTWTGLTGLQDEATSTSIISGNLVAYNLVVATMPATAGSVSLKVQEQSNPKVGIGCLDATGQSLAITVVNQPTYVLPTSVLGGCGITAGVPYNIASTLTGVAPFYVNYTITGVDIKGNVIGGAGQTYQVTVSAADAGNIIIDPTQLAFLSGASSVATTTSGVYTVTINSVWDAVSFKAMNSSSIATTTPASGLASINIYVYPSPVTNPIKFIKVLP